MSRLDREAATNGLGSGGKNLGGEQKAGEKGLLNTPAAASLSASLPAQAGVLGLAGLSRRRSASDSALGAASVAGACRPIASSARGLRATCSHAQGESCLMRAGTSPPAGRKTIGGGRIALSRAHADVHCPRCRRQRARTPPGAGNECVGPRARTTVQRSNHDARHPPQVVSIPSTVRIHPPVGLFRQCKTGVHGLRERRPSPSPLLSCAAC